MSNFQEKTIERPHNECTFIMGTFIQSELHKDVIITYFVRDGETVSSFNLTDILSSKNNLLHK